MKNSIKLVRFCEVVSVSDEYDAGRIKVRLRPEDDAISKNEDLPYAVPLLPKMFTVIPKVGEGVMVFLSEADKGFSQRYYIGPLISQFDYLYDQKLMFGSDSILKGSPLTMDRSVSSVANYRGITPKKTDIAILGRKNCDILLKDDDIRIRAGVKLLKEDDKYQMSFNEKDPSYIKLKYHNDGIGNNTHSTATIVADKINILSNKSSKRRPNNTNQSIGAFNLTDRDELITDSELENVINEAYRLPYGEELVNFLKKFIEIFMKHTHDFPMLPPNSLYVNDLQSAAQEPIYNEGMLSDAIRIN